MSSHYCPSLHLFPARVIICPNIIYNGVTVFKNVTQVCIKVLQVLLCNLQVQNHAWLKVSFNLKDRPMDFKVMKYEKFLHIVSDYN